MLLLATDEDFHGKILRGLLRREPALDIIRVQDSGISGNIDPIVLEWAASEGRIPLTHDRSTIPGFAYDRVDRGQSMPGVFVVHRRATFSRLIDDILLLATCSEQEEWNNRVIHIPL